MSEFNIQSESVDVERIMEQIRARIAEKRGQDYSEAEIEKLAGVKLERFLNPHDVRSDLVEHYGRRPVGEDGESDTTEEPLSLFRFEPDMIYRSSRGLVGKVLYRVRRLLNPILKLFFNPVPITSALHLQQQLNQRYLIGPGRDELDRLTFELMNNLVVEMTRLAIEMKNLKMRVESIAARLDFDERRGRALEGVVQYREDTTAPRSTEGAGDGTAAPSDRPRRRRRRGRRRPAAGGTAPGNEPAAETPPSQAAAETPPSQAATESPDQAAAKAPDTPPSQRAGNDTGTADP